MRIVYIVLLMLFAAGIIYAAETKIDRPLDGGVAISADPNVHQAIYNVLKEKGISCSGLSTRKDGTVTVIGASSATPVITAAEIQSAIDTIKAEQDIEKLIRNRINHHIKRKLV